MIDKIIVFLVVVIATIFFATIIALPTLTAFFINRWLTKKGIKYIGLFLLIIAPIWTVYEVYTAIYPTESFYFSEFKRVTLRDAPKSATIINKDAGYPDFHGDYCSASLISLSSEAYLSLLNDLNNDKRFLKNKSTELIGSDELHKVLGNFKSEQITQRFIRNSPEQEDDYLFIGFLADQKTIVMCVCVT